MIEVFKVKTLAEQKIEGTDNFLVDVKVMPQNRIIVLFDSPSGVNLRDCEEMSRFIEAGLDRSEEDFELTVSSPGLDEPFRVAGQYRKNLNKEVTVLLTDGQRLEGILTSYHGNEITIEQLKNKEVVRTNIELNHIKDTKRVIRFGKNKNQ